MAEIVTPPDVYVLVRDALSSMNLPTSYTIPSPRPAEFARVTATPSEGFRGRRLYVGRAVVEVWAATQKRANDLARDAAARVALLEADVTGPGVYPPDPDTSTPKSGFSLTLYTPGMRSVI